MASPSDLAIEFRQRVEAGFLAFGPDLQHLPLIEEFIDRGASRSTVWGWWTKARNAYANRDMPKPRKPRFNAKPKVEAPAPPPAPAKRTAKAKKQAKPAPPVAVDDVIPAFPPLPPLADLVGMDPQTAMNLMQKSQKAAEDTMEHARGPNGLVRNARLLLQGSEHLRRVGETIARLNETVVSLQDMQRFHIAVLEEIRREAPDVQRRILIRLRAAVAPDDPNG